MSTFDYLLTHLLNLLTPKPRRKAPAGLVLGKAVGAALGDVVVREERRFEHVAIFGKTGTGKTTLLLRLALQHMRQGAGFVFFDYHGDASEQLVRLAAREPAASERLVLLDLTHPDLTPGLNPLQRRERNDSAFARASELTAILKARWSRESFGARTEELLRNTLYTLSVSDYTLVEAPLLLTDANFRAEVVTNLTNEDIRQYWTERFEPLSEPMKAAFREPLLNKITGFITEPTCRHLLGQRSGTFRFADYMRQGAWVIVNLSKGHLGEHALLLGNLLFACLQFDAFERARRPSAERRGFSIIADEVQNLQENGLVTLLAEGRKFGVSLITANQFTDQLSVELRSALLSAGALVCFRLSAQDAGVLAPEMSIRERRLMTERLTELSRGEALARTSTEPAVRFRVPALSVPPSDRNTETLRALTLALNTRGRETVEAEIRGRQRLPPMANQPVPPPIRSPDAQPEAQDEW